jgi:hypothetical protein
MLAIIKLFNVIIQMNDFKEEIHKRENNEEIK